MLKPQYSSQLSVSASHNLNNLLAALSPPGTDASSPSAAELFDHLQRVRDAAERMINLARDTDAQAARYLLRVPFARHPGCLRSLLQLYYPFSGRLLTDHAARLDRHLLSQNIQLVARANHSALGSGFRIDWDLISLNYPFTPAQLKRFVNEIEWDNAALNPFIDWSETLIKKYKSHSNDFFTGISKNPGLRWTAGLLSSFAGEWDGTNAGLLNNDGIAWDDSESLDAIYNYGSIDWEKVTNARDRMEARSWERRSASRHFDWSSDYLRENVDELQWHVLSANPALPFTLELMDEFAERWDWQELATNHGLYEKVLRLWLNDTVVHELLLLTR